ncbi:hypothetical protein PGT21_012836 [Puccinia graminis f. sp. tritici]|uniref:Uncharacterized protein n=2 Tax=Puccinia graminis f. sp. tritici TaxID=56615 RepID=E3KED0_PUCGT|nr:uncharacterized protein PGTG_08859 [Puccinia graminis f. sp. tritici CRL 75-36-700-3]EFP82663.2 hypothetical protein PGTG_08859 [Puccinia graminis f. sp. tritici CRL 75-36-700-3]KAA1086822.1 hypothetical protein PGT21_012836 [Puccinia graminis f. sp. tritici]
MVPRKIYLSFKNAVFAVETKELLIVRELAQAARKECPDDLRGINISQVTLHTNEDADELTSHSRLAKHTAQLLRCCVPETPLIVKVKPKVALKTPLIVKEELDLARFWKALPDARLVTESEMEYLQLKESYVLEDRALGDRFLVRPIYKEITKLFEHQGFTKWVVTGTPGIGKTVFSAYYMWIGE